ncbi:MAG: choice-of-anchor tandem repeat GloVer-containing protein [Verrucomicrobiota bacterium]
MLRKTLSFLCLAVIAMQLLSPALGQAPFNYEQIHSFGSSNVVGLLPGSLTRGLDGRLYGATEAAVSGVGTLYRLDTNGANPEVIHFFANDGTGFSTQQKLVYARDGNLYGWAKSPSRIFQSTGFTPAA